DQATFINTSLDNVRDAILVGGLFSVLILLAFLRSWRATLISALAIPTTLAITFLFLYWSGSTLNLMSLGGLAVAIGLIIDDTVVVVENIARHLAPAKTGLPSTRSSLSLLRPHLRAWAIGCPALPQNRAGAVGAGRPGRRRVVHRRAQPAWGTRGRQATPATADQGT